MASTAQPLPFSYPLRSQRAFAARQWYVAAWRYEVATEPLERTLLGQDVVLWRGESGKVSATAALCPHRWAPLVRGAVVGDALRCPYHGAEFGPDGQCTALPMQDRIPTSLAITAYPVVEIGPFIWIWLGDRAPLGGEAPPDLSAVGLGDEAGWRVDQAGPYPVAARPQIVIENLFDQSHVQIVHPTTLGTGMAHVIHPVIEQIDEEARFGVIRQTPPTPADESVQGLFPTVGPMMIAQTTNELFGAAVINSLGSRIYASDPEGRKTLLGRMNFLHAITPCTARSSYYFVAMTRDFARDEDGLTEVLMERNLMVVQEDIAILEAIEPRLDSQANLGAEVSFSTDSVAVHVRRRMEKLILAEDAA